jgi:hypothetical protein
MTSDRSTTADFFKRVLRVQNITLAMLVPPPALYLVPSSCLVIDRGKRDAMTSTPLASIGNANAETRRSNLRCGAPPPH